MSDNSIGSSCSSIEIMIAVILLQRSVFLTWIKITGHSKWLIFDLKKCWLKQFILLLLHVHSTKWGNFKQIWFGFHSKYYLFNDSFTKCSWWLNKAPHSLNKRTHKKQIHIFDFQSIQRPFSHISSLSCESIAILLEYSSHKTYKMALVGLDVFWQQIFSFCAAVDVVKWFRAHRWDW